MREVRREEGRWVDDERRGEGVLKEREVCE